jgi:2-polyprenyl-6-hydroxyphenyl methylase/3-demethylubiquinone-9 3-methyltransferase
VIVKDRIDRPFDDRTVDPAEIARFEALAEEWWDPNGKMRVMHAFNRVRCDFIQATIARTFHRSIDAPGAFDGIDILDVGCGGGLICEPLAAAGGRVVGVDATARNIEIAKRHLAGGALHVDYRHGTARSALHGAETFDVVLNLEVVEHVADPAQLMADCAARLRPGGMMFVATLNRTFRAWGLAIFGAERVLRWLPVGTHSWRRFLKPKEVSDSLALNGVHTTQTAGVVLNPLKGGWTMSSNTAVNYMLVAHKPSATSV